MKRYFPLDNNHNKLLKEVGDSIKNYYPIGLSRDSPEYEKYPGIIRITESIGEHMDNYNVFIQPWRSFLANLPRGYKSRIHNISMPLDLAYSGELVLDKYQDESLIRIKKITFSVSWLAQYFTIFGIDETFIKEKDDKFPRQRAYSAINVITLSPHKEFESGFNYLTSSILAKFPGYTFIPFEVCSLIVKGLQTPYSNLDESNVHEAFFNNALDYCYNPSTRGDLSYGRG